MRVALPPGVAGARGVKVVSLCLLELHALGAHTKSFSFYGLDYNIFNFLAGYNKSPLDQKTHFKYNKTHKFVK